MPEARPPVAGGAATLIAIILVIMIFYILLLPPELRPLPEKLLEAKPGLLKIAKAKTLKHALPDFKLEEVTKGKVFAELGSFRVWHGLFTKSFKSFGFTLPEPENVENALLSFQATRRSGELVIKLNGIEIFSERVRAVAQQVVLPKALLKQDNVIEFEVRGGLFEGKRYALADVKIIGDVLDIARQKAMNTFVVSAEEFGLFESGSIRYWISCEQAAVGTLSLTLNGIEIFSGMPLCNAAAKVDIAKAELGVGRNFLIWRLERGAAWLEQIEIELKLKAIGTWSGEFEVNASLADVIRKGERKAVLKLSFSEGVSEKVLDVDVNGKLFFVSQRAESAELDISSGIVAGRNSITLSPRTDVEVVELVVGLE